ncbi:uncharacterized protein LOC108223098 isoform X6 [Daucus carota subsp. sativus]|uniref:uncharacterized protein LOC108223098 isoform X6 n=1 Tax=Daucus carota subsp. sativus TaxID=79200 RepID=UPI003083A592
MSTPTPPSQKQASTEEDRKPSADGAHINLKVKGQKADPAAIDGDKFTSKPGNKRKATAVTASGRKRKVNDAPTSKPGTSFCNAYGHHFVFLIEFASGYALFDAHGMYEYPGFTTTFKIAEKYLNNNPFTLRAFYPFLSVGDALIQMKAICNSTVTKELKNFVVDNIPERISDYWIAVANARLAQTIGLATGIPAIAGHIIDEVMRGLWVKFDKFITGLELENMKMARLNLARSYRRQSCAHKESSMVQRVFYTVDKVVVVPHKFEGLFITKGLGKKNFICTKNLVPGKVLYGEKLISVQDGLVYVIGLSDAVANTVGERSNVVTLPGNLCFRKDSNVVRCRDYRFILGMDYRMVVGMVDVLLGDIIYPEDCSLQLSYIRRYAQLHLKTGGHYLISTRAKHINLTSQVKDLFDKLPFHLRIEFETKELVMLKPIGRGHAMAVGVYRVGK